MELKVKMFVTNPSHQHAKLLSAGSPTMEPSEVIRFEAAMKMIICIRPRRCLAFKIMTNVYNIVRLPIADKELMTVIMIEVVDES